MKLLYIGNRVLYALVKRDTTALKIFNLAWKTPSPTLLSHSHMHDIIFYLRGNVYEHHTLSHSRQLLVFCNITQWPARSLRVCYSHFLENLYIQLTLGLNCGWNTAGGATGTTERSRNTQSHKRGRLLYCKHASFPGTQPHACSKKYTRRREGGGGGGGEGGQTFYFIHDVGVEVWLAAYSCRGGMHMEASGNEAIASMHTCTEESWIKLQPYLVVWRLNASAQCACMDNPLLYTCEISNIIQIHTVVRKTSLER